MTDKQDIGAKVARLERLLGDRLGAGSGTLAQRLRRVGRDLPRGIRKDLGIVAEAAHLSGHPRLAIRLDADRIAAAFARAESHLRGIDAVDRRRGRLIGMLAGLVVNLGLAAVLLLVLLRWRGYL